MPSHPRAPQAQPASYGRQDPAFPRTERSLLLITVDALRADLGYAGNPRPVSPNLDRLAERSVVYENAYALASYTGKSVGPLFIGKYASETHRDWAHFNRFGNEDIFVQERLHRAGVRTVSVQGFWYLAMPTMGFERGFDVVDFRAVPKVGQDTETMVNSDRVSDNAIEQLTRLSASPQRFFMWVHYIDAHAKYMQHPEFAFGTGSRARYDSEVAFVDKHVGRVLDFVANGPLARRTAIVVTSDHGEAFAEHGMTGHGFELWEELVRVPLIVHVPGVAPRRIQVRRSAVDLVPTVLDLFGLPRPSHPPYDFVSGTSLWPELQAGAGEAPVRPVLIDMPPGPNNPERQAFIEDDMKLVTSAGRPIALFDLRADPGEKTNLLGDEPRSAAIAARYARVRRSLALVSVKPAR